MEVLEACGSRSGPSDLSAGKDLFRWAVGMYHFSGSLPDGLEPLFRFEPF